MSIKDLENEQEIVRLKKDFDAQAGAFDGICQQLKAAIDILEAVSIYSTTASKTEKELITKYRSKLEGVLNA